MVSDEQIIQVELGVGVSIFAIFLINLGLSVSGISSWNTVVTLLLAWMTADWVATLTESRTRGKFKIPLTRNKLLPFPHRITVAYFLYPIGILIAIFYSEVVTAILLAGLSLMQRYSLLALLPLSNAERQGQYVGAVSFIVSILLYHDFRSRADSEEEEEKPKNN